MSPPPPGHRTPPLLAGQPSPWTFANRLASQCDDRGTRGARLPPTRRRGIKGGQPPNHMET
eukprot:8677067-Alexandrium_andersonii.AAC.1